MKPYAKKFIIILIFDITLLAGNRHLPWCGGDIGHTAPYSAECYGYAMARAYNRSWNHPVCPAHSFPGDLIKTPYFKKVNATEQEFDYRLIVVGDILTYTDHAVYVVEVPGWPRDTIPNGIYVDHKLNPGTSYQTLHEELTSINSSQQQEPKYIWRRNNVWEITVKNSFEEGRVKVAGTQRNSGWTESNLRYESWVSLDAIEDGNVHGGYVQRFQNWKKNGALQNKPKSTSVEIVDDWNSPVIWEAVFKNEYDITFLNHFIGIGNKGIIKVDDVQYNQPTSVFHIKEDESIKGEAINQPYNAIYYSFNYWSDGVSNYSDRIKTFYPSDHRTYTAYFTGRPNQVQNVHFDCDIGEPIHIVWEQHTNSNCQYKIYRKTRDQYGHTTGPTLLATLPHSTTSYTDNQYMKAATYVFLLSYDVRAYYTVESTAADPHWISVYGESDIKYDSTGRVTSKLLSPCKRFTLGNYPNPFNPVTTIYYELARETSVRLAIYDLSGSRVKTVVDKTQPAGVYKILWNGMNENGNNVSSGIYFLRLESPALRITRKLFLLR